VIRNARFAEAVAGIATGATWRWLQQQPAAIDAQWRRHNYRDREVSLLLGPAVAAGTLAGLAVGVPGPRRGAMLAVATAAVVGGYDDHFGDSHARGFGGHLRALGEGRLTTGMAKLLATAGAAALGSRLNRRRAGDVAIDTVLVAGTANLINLFDLRPGRAAKVSLLASGLLRRTGDRPARSAAAVASGAALAALPLDLREHAMLGDCGAAALGAILGTSATMRRSRLMRLAIAGGVVGLNLASERVSFTAVIDRHPVLRAIDQAGRTVAAPSTA
jgi:UDP-N-acetylmuramyl pentapeptide phosphotransferase/UDP-N-acetylglucosamine-1-phosphate transferase